MDMQSVEKIIPLIYEAGFDEDVWPDVGAQLSSLFGDAGIGIDSLAAISQVEALAVSARINEAMREMHFEEYDTPDKNPGVAALLRAPVGKPFDFHSFVDRKLYDSDPSIRGILHPEKIDKGLFVTLERNGGSFGFMSVFRRAGQAEFERDDLLALEMLAHHISRSCKLRRLLLERQLQNSTAALKSQSGRTIEGTMLVLLNGSILEADAGAKAILHTNIGLIERGGRLVSNSRVTGQTNEALAHFLSSCATSSPQSFSIWRQNNTLTTIEKHPLPNGFLKTTPERHCTMLIMRCIFPTTQPNIDAFASAYSLTKAETRVVVALTKSPTATKAAASIGICRDTIKTHLTHIYAKTQVESLPQLMMLVGRFG